MCSQEEEVHFNYKMMHLFKRNYEVWNIGHFILSKFCFAYVAQEGRSYQVLAMDEKISMTSDYIRVDICTVWFIRQHFKNTAYWFRLFAIKWESANTSC